MAEIQVERSDKTYTLAISVVDQDGDGVAGAVGKITDDEDGPYGDNAISDSAGVVWWDRTPGIYYVQISGDDFQTVEYVVDLDRSETRVWERERYYR